MEVNSTVSLVQDVDRSMEYVKSSGKHEMGLCIHAKDEHTRYCSDIASAIPRRKFSSVDVKKIAQDNG